MPSNDFFATLCAPFRDDEIGYRPGGGGREYPYVKPRAIMNRLDDVCGPSHWQVEYRPVGDRGFTCAISIHVETASGGEWITKEDGGGYADMADADNTEKSGYTDAFKRAAVAWGIGRYLYGEGVPSGYLTPELDGPTQKGQPARQPQQAPRQQQQGQQSRGVGNLPKHGRALFAWAKNLESHYNARGIVDLINEYGKRGGLPGKMVDWDAEDVRRASLDAARTISGCPCYKGEFDAVLREEDEQESAQFDEPKQAAKPAPDHANINNLKRAIVDVCKQYQKATGLENPTYDTVCKLLESASGITHFAEFQDYPGIQALYGKVCDLLEKAQAAPADDIPF